MTTETRWAKGTTRKSELSDCIERGYRRWRLTLTRFGKRRTVSSTRTYVTRKEAESAIREFLAS